MALSYDGALAAVVSDGRAASTVRGASDAARVALGLALVMSLAAATLLPTGADTSRSGARATLAGPHVRFAPAGLLAAASTSLGATQPAFWPAQHNGALVTRGGGIAASFTATGPRVRAAAGTVSLSLSSIARGARTMRIGAVAPVASSSEVAFERAAVSEYYQAGPYGLEQSFSLPRSPLSGSGSLVLLLRTAGDLVPRQSGSEIALSPRRGASLLEYGQLSARDAAGRRLPASLRVRGNTLLLVIGDAGARYPLRIDPFVTQGKLTGAEESGAGTFGASVALSSDGSTAIIGGPSDNSNVGASWVFTRSGETWTQQGGKLTGGEETGKARFGFGVALSADGNTALIGGPIDNTNKGAAWVFTRSGETWTQQGSKLTGGGEAGKGEFGEGTALSGDGATALIGGGGDNLGAGAAWVFILKEGKWEQQGGKLTGSGEVGSEPHFGFSAALSEDGNTALIGGGGDNSGVGAAWVFTRAAEKWSQQGEKLTGTGEVGAGHVAFSVALSGDGNTAMLGGVADKSEVGAAWVFTRSGEIWTQQGEKLKASDETGAGLFGYSVGLSGGEGNLAVIGAPGNSSSVGATWVFRRAEGKWEQLGPKFTGSGEVGKGRFGQAVAISRDASTAIFGGGEDNAKIGAAWPFANIKQAPTVVTQAATTVAGESAVLNASVNPNAETVTDCHFKWGTTPAYGSTAPCAKAPGSGASAVPVSAALTGLSANTVYHFQIVATNATGTSEGADQSFATVNPPELGRCSKLAPGVKGQFATAACTTAATAEKFAYEWSPGAGAKPGFTMALTVATTVTLETTGKKLITCKGQTGKGEYASAKTVAGVTFTLTGCEMSASPCTSTGAAEGEVVTKTLEGTLGVEKTSLKGAIGNKIALELFPVGATGPVAEFSCGTTAVVVSGAVLVPVLSNKMLSTETLKFTQVGGKQKPEKFVGMPADVLMATIGEAAAEQTGLGLSTLVTNGEKIEVNSVV